MTENEDEPYIYDVPLLKATERNTSVNSLQAVYVISCHFTHIQIQCTLLNMHQGCVQGDGFISKARLWAMRKTQG